MSPCLWPRPEWRDMIKYNPLKLGNMFMADKDEASAAQALPATAPTVRVLPDISLLFADTRVEGKVDTAVATLIGELHGIRDDVRQAAPCCPAPPRSG